MRSIRERHLTAVQLQAIVPRHFKTDRTPCRTNSFFTVSSTLTITSHPLATCFIDQSFACSTCETSAAAWRPQGLATPPSCPKEKRANENGAGKKRACGPPLSALRHFRPKTFSSNDIFVQNISSNNTSKNHFIQKLNPEGWGAPKGGGPDGWGARRVGTRRVGQRRGPKVAGPKVAGETFRAFFLSRHNFHSVFPLLGVFSSAGVSQNGPKEPKQTRTM